MIAVRTETTDVQASVATADVSADVGTADVVVSVAKRADLEVSARIDAL